jgi:phosphoribosylglycinamide formyltransferase 2
MRRPADAARSRYLSSPCATGVAEAMQVPASDLRLFGKPESFKKRCMGVAVANADDTDETRRRAKLAASKVKPVAG